MKKQITDYAVITLGLLIFAFAWVAFIVPNQIVGGGISGISALVFYAAGVKFEYTYFAVNLGLFLLGIKVLGKQFGIKTLYCILASTIMFRYLPYIIPEVLIEQVKGEKNLLLWTLVGGILEGAGIGIALMQGGNSGGTDIIALIINKFKHISPGRVLLCCDVLIIGSSIFLPEHTILSLLYGCILVVTSTYVIDVLLVGAKRSMQILIFSDKQDEIADRIMEVLGRGVTMLSATGWYTKKQKNVILVVVRKHEVTNVYRIVKSIDNKAFLTTSSVTDVYGEGFDPIKDGIILRQKQVEKHT